MISKKKNFQENIQISEAWTPTEDMKFRLEISLHTPFYSWTQYSIKIVLDT